MESTFFVDYYVDNDLLLSTDIVLWDQYITALKASDSITIKGNSYNIKSIEMVHVENNTLSIQLNVMLEESRRKSAFFK